MWSTCQGGSLYFVDYFPFMYWQIVQTDDLESKFIGLEPVQKLFI